MRILSSPINNNKLEISNKNYKVYSLIYLVIPDQSRFTIFGWFISKRTGIDWLELTWVVVLYKETLLTGGIWMQHTALLGKINENKASPVTGLT